MRFGRGGGFRARRRAFANNYNDAPVAYEGEPVAAPAQQQDQQPLRQEILELKSQIDELKQALAHKPDK
jgi:hypothetical protein